MGSRSVARKRSLDESETSSLSEGAEGQKFPKRPWQKEEDAVLLRVVTQYQERHGVGKAIHWCIIASQVAKAGVVGRDNKSCNLRWKSSLSGSTLPVKLNPFTPQEDSFISQARAMWLRRDARGNVVKTQWTLIARCLPGRSHNDVKNRWNAHLSKRAGQVPNGPPRGGMTLEELEREFGIIENMLELIKANAAQYKVVHVPAYGPAPSTLQAPQAPEPDAMQAELLEAVLPPTQPTEPLAAMLARPAIAPAADGNIFPEADPGFPTMDEPLHDFLAQPPQPDAMQAEAVLPPTQPTEPLPAPGDWAEITPLSPGPALGAGIFPETDSDFLTMDEPLHAFLAGHGFLSEDEAALPTPAAVATAASQPPQPNGVDELELAGKAFKERATPFVAQAYENFVYF